MMSLRLRCENGPPGFDPQMILKLFNPTVQLAISVCWWVSVRQGRGGGMLRLYGGMATHKVSYNIFTTWYIFFNYLLVYYFVLTRFVINKIDGVGGVLIYNGSDKTFPTWFVVTFTYFILHWSTTWLWKKLSMAQMGWNLPTGGVFCRSVGSRSDLPDTTDKYFFNHSMN